MKTELVRGSISASKPVDWYAKESHAYIAPDGRANVIASSEPLDPDIDSRSYAAAQGDLLRSQFPSYREHVIQQGPVFGGRPGYLRRFSWQPEDGEAVTQLQLYYAENGRGYTATATAPTDDFPRFERDLVNLLDSLRI